jgi:two-component system NtrC family sensor kinase
MPTEPTARILVVDDHEAILNVYGKLLGRAGSEPGADTAGPRYHLDRAIQGAIAVERVAAAVAAGHPYAVAFVDIQMPPGIDGIEAVAQMWAIQPDLEVVLCTAHAEYGWHDIAGRLSTPHQLVILRKPFEAIEVRQLAACLSEKWRRGRALAERVADLEARVAARVRIEIDVAKFEALGRLAAGVAHEINTPLQYVQTSLEFVDDACRKIDAVLAQVRIGAVPAPAELDEVTALTEEIPQGIADAQQGVARIVEIIRSVRDYAHPARARHQRVDLARQCQLAVELTRLQLRGEAEVVLELAEVPAVRGHTSDLGGALVALVVNAGDAIRARRRGAGPLGRVVLRTALVPGAVQIQVCDDGVGIPAELLGRIFEPFFTTKPPGEGTGQGLALARATIVDGHHGTLTVESMPGQGTTFTISLPVGPDEP